MKTIISPSILGGSFSNMEKTISELDKSKADYIHFDVMDGDFVPNLTFGPQFISDLRSKTKKVFDVHLMIHRVGDFLEDYVNAGSNIITFHYEINENLNEIISKIKKNRIKAGIAIKPKTTLDEVRDADLLLHVVDISHPNFQEQIEIVNKTLDEINKDLCSDNKCLDYFKVMLEVEKQ